MPNMKVKYKDGEYTVIAYGKKESFESFTEAKAFIDNLYLEIEQRKMQTILLAEYMPMLHSTL